jgi:hypothetical protein
MNCHSSVELVERMLFQYVSDIHLEFHDKHNTGSLQPDMFVKPVAPYLVLAGDIGIPELKSYPVFLNWCSSNWKHVFLVAGNHEYYNVRCPLKSDMATKKEQIRGVCETLPNVHFLDCSSYYLPEENLRILGCTLWSEIPDCIREKVITYTNDARQILHQKDTPFIPSAMSDTHLKEKQWLNQEIHQCELTNEKCLVITHYLPSFQLIHEKYKGHSMNACFASECDDLFRPPVVAWICGHTHTGMRLRIHGVPCVINPYGYPHEDVETRDRAATIGL